MTSPDWMEQQTRADAEAVARQRLERYDRERKERLAQYALTLERRWAVARAAAASGAVPSLWRLVK